MKPIYFAILLFAIACIFFFVLASCGDDDDDDSSDSGDSKNDTGTCDAYCEKVISCGDPSWDSAAACSENCEISGHRDCFLDCDTALNCGDFFTCMAEC